jgi:hypothetical protein
MRWAGRVKLMGKRRSVYSVLLEKPEPKRPIERPGLMLG